MQLRHFIKSGEGGRAGYDQRHEQDVAQKSTSSRDANARGETAGARRGKATFDINFNEAKDEREKYIIASI